MTDKKDVKTITADISEIVMNKIVEIDDSDMHANKKASELKHVAIGQVEVLRSKVKSLNTLKNSFSAIRKNISLTGIPHHLLRSKIAEIDKAYASAVKLSDIYRSCDGDLSMFSKRVKQKADELISLSAEKYKTGDTEQARKLSERAEAFTSLKVFPESWYIFKLNDSERKVVESESQNNRDEKLRNKVSIGVNSYLELAQKLMKDNHYIRKALGLAMLSGRRVSEIFVSAHFEALSDDTLIFSGAIKKTLLDGTLSSNENHEIPSMIDADEFIYHFNKFREDEKIKDLIDTCNKDKSFTAVNKTIGTMANYNARMQLSKLDPERKWKFSDTRAMAVAVAWFLESKKEKRSREEDEVIFYKDYLAHDDVETMLSYREFFIVPDSTDVCKTLLDKLHDAEEDVLRYSARSSLSTDRILKIHDALCDYVAKNPDAKINKALLKKTKKQGGIGAAHDVTVEYFEMIKPYID